jgi:hypothetical protein
MEFLLLLLLYLLLLRALQRRLYPTPRNHGRNP